MSKLLARFVLAVALLAAGSAPSFAQGSLWQMDPAHSTAQFSVRHLMISNVRGEFSGVTGNVILDQNDPTQSSVEVSIDTTTVNTREPKRDAHLRSADFFNVEKYPVMTFRSKRITPVGNGRLQMTGDLTIRGVTREVTFDVGGPSAVIRDPRGNERVGATATTRINRKDFGLLWNAALESGGVVVGDEVAITLDVELIKKVGTASGQ